MIHFLMHAWPWYVSGPIIGLVVPLLLFLGNKLFGVSENLRHICAICNVGEINFFDYDWKSKGLWNLFFIGGTIIGGFLANNVFNGDGNIDISKKTVSSLQTMGIHNFNGLLPAQIFSWSSLTHPADIIILVAGGFLIGFGSRYAGGCTSGHAISGLADLQLASLIAVVGFFIGGLIMTYFILPFLLAGLH
ncbi:MAG TPA: YeeE/YedE thiosulfate transporter family protein [Balneolales bacterium]|nr:YeeE/YedE thiosulfate transporter family protein [Balneolales bacterium]